MMEMLLGIGIGLALALLLAVRIGQAAALDSLEDAERRGDE